MRELQEDTLPMDSLARSPQLPPSVEVLTPAGAVGREWDTVIVAGLVEGSWPNPRVRDTFLKAGLVRSFARGAGHGQPETLRETAAENIGDEARLLVAAASRARCLLVALGTVTEGREPSRFLGPLAGVPLAELTVWQPVHRAGGGEDVSLPRYAAALRRELLDAAAAGEDITAADPRVRLLAVLAEAAVPGATPQAWRALVAATSSAPLRQEEDVIVVSPSAVEWALKCPARWVMTTCGATDGASTAQEVGNMVHDFAERFPRAEQAGEMREALAEWVAQQDVTTLEAQRRIAAIVTMVELLADYVESVPGAVRVERRMRFRYGNILVAGRLDRLEELEAGSVRVVDFKTGQHDTDHAVVGDKGRRDLSRLEFHPQLGIYQYGVACGGLIEDPEFTRCAEAMLVNLKNPLKSGARRQRQAELTETGWVEELLREVEELMRGSQFPARTGAHCRTCPVQNLCPVQAKGRRVR